MIQIIGITKITDPTMKRHPWKVSYLKDGKEYASHESSFKKAQEYAEYKRRKEENR